MPSDYAKALGARLRAIRTQQGLSLHGVEEKSKGRWKAVVVGSYERGDRAVTVQRLAELADFYGVPVAELLPDGGAGAAAEPPPRARPRPGAAVATSPAEKAGPLARYAATIQSQRGDYNGRVLSIRQDDLRALAVIYDAVAEPSSPSSSSAGACSTAEARRAARRLTARREHRPAASMRDRPRCRAVRARRLSATRSRDPAEQAVDEARRVVGRQLLGQLHRLADRDRVGDVVAPEQLVDRRSAAIVAVDRRHPVQRPALGVGRDQLVDPVAVRDDALDQRDRVRR